MRPEKQPKGYAPQKSLDEIPITKVIRNNHQEYIGERGSSITTTFSNEESTGNSDGVGPQNNKGRVCKTQSKPGGYKFPNGKGRVASEGA